MNRTAIKCSYCGQRVGRKELMASSQYPRMFDDALVHIRYRCSRCKKIGEQFVKQEEWDSGILQDKATEAVKTEKERFAEMGAIEMRELVEFHEALEKLPDLSELNAEFKPKRGSNDKSEPGENKKQ